MPYDVLVKQAQGLTDDEISAVLEYIAFLRFRSDASAHTKTNYEGWVRVPGKHGDLFQILDGFDDPVEGFEEYM